MLREMWLFLTIKLLQRKIFVSFVCLNGNVLVGGNKEKEARVSCSYLCLLFDQLGH